MPIATTAVHHVRLTVRDLATSRRFYDDVFGWDVAYELPPDADEATREQLSFLFGGLIYATPWGLFGLRPVAPGGDTFSEDRVGLDHVSLLLADLPALEDAARQLDELGIAHEPIKDAGGLSILEFRDPDNIALELSAPTG
ncbi:VOC family protein [Nocardioides sp.]|uniref:VOC family protein n=1 Tax=Nocardioides sp. TaxID=35761 RepID=UPI0035152376